jgi:hypothetical protein
MSTTIHKLYRNGDILILKGELREATSESRLVANTTVVSVRELDEVTYVGTQDGILKRESRSGTLLVSGEFNEVELYRESLYNIPGTYSWTAPVGAITVSALCIGGGGGGSGPDGSGGGGGGLGWKNSIPVTAGQSYTLVVGAGGAGGNVGVAGGAGGASYFISNTTVAGFGGSGGILAPNDENSSTTSGGLGGSYAGDGGGTGGQGGTTINDAGYFGGQSGGGGGAGGYSGNGGRGGSGSITSSPGTLATAGSQGGGGGGGTGYGIYGNGNGTGAGAGGGGVGVYGSGTNGAAGLHVFGSPGYGTPGSGGSGGQNGGDSINSFIGGQFGGNGGAYGGGGGGANGRNNAGPITATGGNGGSGAVRLVWSLDSLTREFPTTNVGRIFGPIETGYVLVSGVSSTYTAAWNSSLRHQALVTFDTDQDIENFFTLGGNVRISATYTGTSASLKETTWVQILNTIGSVYYTANNFRSGGNITLRTVVGSGDYTGAYYRAFGELINSRQIRITSVFDDATAGEFTDENINLDITSTVQYYRPFGVITGPTATVSTTQALGP